MYTITMISDWSNDTHGKPVTYKVATWADAERSFAMQGGLLLDVNNMECDDPTRFVGLTVYVSKEGHDSTFRKEYAVTSGNELHAGSWVQTSNAYN